MMDNAIFNISLYDFFIIFVFILILFNLCIFVIMTTHDSKLLIIILGSTFIMFLLLLIHNYYFKLPFSGNDDLRFELLALNFYNGWTYNIPINIFQNSYFYSLLLGVIYYLVGVHELIPGMFNIIFYILTIIFIYKIYMLVFNDKKGLYLALCLVSFSVFNIIFTVISLREIQVTLAIVMMLYFSLKYHKSKKTVYIIGYLLICFIGSQFHIGLIGFLIFIAFQYYFSERGMKKVLFPIFIIGILLVSLTITTDAKLNSILDNDNTQVSEYELSGADYHIPIDAGILNPISIVLKIIYFLTQPLPWDINGFNALIGFILNIFIIFMIFGIYKTYKTNRKTEILLCLFYILTCLSLFALGTSNYGTGFRHKHKFLLLFMIFLPSLTIYKNYYKGVLSNSVSYLKKYR